ncbi:MAG: glutathione S-transferase family protein [Parvularculaceae bacterium]|jgi:glutathione S-transferase|nr:glutathione S-transferase family protein [Parvularculaceae bacterium]
MELKVYHCPPTRSVRIVWALEELGLPYETKRVALDREYFKTPEWRAISPTGKVPVFYDGDRALVESVAITHYLSEKYAGGRLSRRPTDADYGEFLQWIHYGEAGMGPYAGMLIGQTRLLPENQRIEAMKVWALGECKNACGFIENSLGDRPCILGADFSLADISLGYMLHLIRLSGESKSIFGPKTAEYYRRLTGRPAWIKATQ